MTGHNHYADCTCGWCVNLGGRGGRQRERWATTRLEAQGYAWGRVAWSFVSPNATCPVCGASVFIYANAHGSRVYFDDLGPPWPKHPCTDTPRYQRSRAKQPAAVSPIVRSSTEIWSIAEDRRTAGIVLEIPFEYRHGHRPWRLLKIVERFDRGDACLLVAKVSSIDGDALQDGLFFVMRPPDALRSGVLAFFRGSRLSFFDDDKAEVVELPVERLRGIGSLVERLERRHDEDE